MATTKQVEPKITTVVVNYNSSLKFSLEPLGKEYKFDSLQVGDSETRTYDVTGMSEENVDAFVEATREVLKHRIDAGLDKVRAETLDD